MDDRIPPSHFLAFSDFTRSLGAPEAKGSSTKNNQIFTKINKKCMSHQSLISQKSIFHYIKKISTIHVPKNKQKVNKK